MKGESKAAPALCGGRWPPTPSWWGLRQAAASLHFSFLRPAMEVTAQSTGNSLGGTDVFLGNSGGGSVQAAGRGQTAPAHTHGGIGEGRSAAWLAQTCRPLGPAASSPHVRRAGGLPGEVKEGDVHLSLLITPLSSPLPRFRSHGPAPLPAGVSEGRGLFGTHHHIPGPCWQGAQEVGRLSTLPASQLQAGSAQRAAPSR